MKIRLVVIVKGAGIQSGRRFFARGFKEEKDLIKACRRCIRFHKIGEEITEEFVFEERDRKVVCDQKPKGPIGVLMSI